MKAGEIKASAYSFIEECRLLYINQGLLKLWDFSARDTFKPVIFKLGQGLKPTRIHRSYELNNTQWFRVNPEEGIVVVAVEGCPGFNTLVIPTNVFARSYKAPRPRLFGTSSTAVSINIQEWGEFVLKFQIPQGSSFHVFHTHILCLELEDIDSQYTRVRSSVFDFSLYCRKAVGKDPSTLAGRYVPKGGIIEPYQSSFYLPRPLAANLHGGFDLPTLIEDHKPLPTENGVLIIKVRTPMTAKCKF